MRVGIGYDVHAFGPGDHVTLGGEKVRWSQGVLAHSDGDVLLHALCEVVPPQHRRLCAAWHTQIFFVSPPPPPPPPPPLRPGGRGQRAVSAAVSSRGRGGVGGQGRAFVSAG